MHVHDNEHMQLGRFVQNVLNRFIIYIYKVVKKYIV